MEQRQLEIFFEIHDDIPRGGPGNYDSTQRAFSTLEFLPDKPSILDIGCGPGMQTLHLAQITNGRITALDNHQPFLNRLRKTVEQNNLAQKIESLQAEQAEKKKDLFTELEDKLKKETEKNDALVKNTKSKVR